MAGEDSEYTTEVSINDVDAAAAAAAAAPKKLEGDDVPEEFRGKSVTEVAEMVQKHRDALRISEEARIKALEARPAVITPAPTEPAAPVQKPPMTQDEFDALYETDPKAALAVFAEQQEARIMQNVDARIRNLAAGNAVSVEQSMRTKFATEFELFGDEIKAFTAKIPDKSVLASPESWEQLISFVRGKPGNIDKLIEHRVKKNTDAAAEAARAAEAAGAGFSSKTPVVTTGPRSGGDPTFYGLDETERRVADALGQSYSEYAKYKGMR